MKRILFQGDSITDAGRSRDNDRAMGRGYPTLVSSELGFDHPGEYEFFNRGISGDRSIDLLARVKSDIINLRPDHMSLLVGINDVWHELNYKNGVDVNLYEIYCNMIITQVKVALPNISIMILEPFVLKAAATEKNWEIFRTEVEKRALVSKTVAEMHGLVFVPLMHKFDEAAELAGPAYWLEDGIHPTAAGHELIAREWIKAFQG